MGSGARIQDISVNVVCSGVWALRVVVWVNLRWKSDFQGLFVGEISIFDGEQTGNTSAKVVTMDVR